VSLVTEENAVRAMATIAEQTTGLDFEKLVLPENYLEKYKDPMTLDEFEEVEEEVAKPGGEPGHEGNDHGKGKGRAREKSKKSAKLDSDMDDDMEDEPEPESPGRVLNNLVSCSY
jgi:hypothetical protein